MAQRAKRAKNAALRIRGEEAGRNGVVWRGLAHRVCRFILVWRVYLRMEDRPDERRFAVCARCAQ
jgi:hypothetical protein